MRPLSQCLLNVLEWSYQRDFAIRGAGPVSDPGTQRHAFAACSSAHALKTITKSFSLCASIGSIANNTGVLSFTLKVRRSICTYRAQRCSDRSPPAAPPHATFPNTSDWPLPQRDRDKMIARVHFQRVRANLTLRLTACKAGRIFLLAVESRREPVLPKLLPLYTSLAGPLMTQFLYWRQGTHSQVSGWMLRNGLNCVSQRNFYSLRSFFG